jgi:PAS domain S-box-containing protein
LSTSTPQSSFAELIPILKTQRESQQALDARVREHTRALMELIGDPAVLAGSFDDGVRRITEIAAIATGVARAGVWLLDDFGRTLVCADIYLSLERVHGEEQSTRLEFPASYLAALSEERAVAVQDVRSDSRVADMIGTYFESRGIGATLDAPVRVRGVIVGVLCLEQVGGPRVWTMDEAFFVSAMADQAAQLLLRMDHARAEQSAREATERLQEIFAHTTEAIFSLRVTSSRDFIFEEFNAAAVAMCGVTASRACGRRPQDLLPAAVAAQFNDNFRRCLELGKAIEYIESIDFGTGAGMYQTFLIPLRNEAGRIHRIAGFTRDVTEQTMAEQALRVSEEKFSKAFRSCPDAISVSDADSGRFMEVNEGFERLFQCKAAEVIGQTSLDMRLWANPADRDKLLLAIRARGAVRNFEATVRTRKGELRPCILAAETVQIGGRSCLVLVTRDITEQREAERVQEELAAQLRQAQKLEALGQLAGGIAHDFNNILTAIMAYTELASIDLERPWEVRGHLEQVQAASNRARDLVRRILTFSRQRKQERRPVQLRSLVEEAVSLIQSTLPATIEVESRLSPDSPVVLADLSQVHQVLMNLCTNSGYAMRDRPGRLVVCLERVHVDAALVRSQPDLREGCYALLSVSDTGSGMAPEVMKRVFEPFFTTKPPGEGTGLGLSVVHGIMQDHEGAVLVESRLGHGTTFRLFFPEEISVATLAPSSVPVWLPGRGERVLFIDDEQALCDSTRLILEKLGYKATVQSSPVAALEDFRKHPEDFDLVITDLTMPFITGMELAREVLSLRPELPVLVASGFSGVWTAEKVRAEGVRDLLTKPLTASALSVAIRRVLDVTTES